MSRVIVDIVGDKQVQPAITVEVQKCCGRAPSSSMYLRFSCEILKPKIAQILIESAVTGPCQAKIGSSIIGKIRDGDTAGNSIEGQRGSGTDIFELTGFQLSQDLNQGCCLFR